MVVEPGLNAWDHLRFNAWFYYYHSWLTRLVTIAALVNLVLFVVVAVQKQQGRAMEWDKAPWALFFPAAWFVFMPSSAVLSFLRTRRSNPTLFRGTYEFTDSGVTFRSQMATSDESWGLYRRVVETRWDFYVFLTNRAARIIPKRVLTEEQVVELRNVFASKIAVK